MLADIFIPALRNSLGTSVRSFLLCIQHIAVFFDGFPLNRDLCRPPLISISISVSLYFYFMRGRSSRRNCVLPPRFVHIPLVMFFLFFLRIAMTFFGGSLPTTTFSGLGLIDGLTFSSGV